MMDEKIKARFHRDTQKTLREVASQLGLQPGTYEVRSNKAGPATLGEVTLHHERIYVQACVGYTGVLQVLYRTCKGRKDYTGGANHWMDLDQLFTDEGVERLRRLLA